MKEFWNKRYVDESYAYGEAPNEYLKTVLSEINPGKILFPMEGEGRNAVYAAMHGWKVAAFDQSEEGKKKAELLASKNDVTIDYIVSEIGSISYDKSSFDALALIYAHLPEQLRSRYHKALSELIRPGGILIIEGFSKEHIQYQEKNPLAGGPKDVTMLYDLEELKRDFPNFEFLEAYETQTELKEGLYHVGTASVVRIVAKKIDIE